MNYRVLLCVILLVCIAGCEDVTLESSWRDSDITIDGEGADWEGIIQHIDWANAGIGVCNDDSAVYISLTPRNRDTQASIIGNGLVVWLDSKENDRFGLHFPFGSMTIAEEFLRDASRSNTIELIKGFAEKEQKIEILDNWRKVLTSTTYDELNDDCIAVSIGESHGRLFIEARIPYKFSINDTHFEVDKVSNSIIDMVLQTPDDPYRTGGTAIPVELVGNSNYYDQERYQDTDGESSDKVRIRSQLHINLSISLATIND